MNAFFFSFLTATLRPELRPYLTEFNQRWNGHVDGHTDIHNDHTDSHDGYNDITGSKLATPESKSDHVRSINGSKGIKRGYKNRKSDSNNKSGSNTRNSASHDGGIPFRETSHDADHNKKRLGPSATAASFFSQLSANRVSALHEVFGDDFAAFGYPDPDNYYTP